MPRKSAFLILCLLFCGAAVAGCNKKSDNDESAKENAKLKNQLAEKTLACETAYETCREMTIKLDEQEAMHKHEFDELMAEKAAAEKRVIKADAAMEEYKARVKALEEREKELLTQLDQKTAIIEEKDKRIKLLTDVIEDLRKTEPSETEPAE